VQCFELDLTQYRGMVPVELSGGTKFPAVGERPYFLNLGPFAFYWFSLEREVAPELVTQDAPMIAARSWDEIFDARNRDGVGRALRAYLLSRRWFGGKGRSIASVTVRDAVEIPNADGGAERRLAILDVELNEGEPQTYQLPLGIANVRREQDQARNVPVIARLREGAVLYEPVQEEGFANALLDAVARKRQLRGKRGVMAGSPTRALKELRGAEKLETHVLGVEQSNTAIIYGQRLFLKLFRRMESGINTDAEVTRFLNEETSFRNTPRLAGTIEYREENKAAITSAILQGYLPNSGDAWAYTLDSIGRYYDTLLSDPGAAERIAKAVPGGSIMALSHKPLPDIARETIGSYIADAELLGLRTAQLHLALASRDDIPAFAPEPFTPHYQRSIYQSMRTQIVQTMQFARRHANENPELEPLLSKEETLHQQVRAVLHGKIEAARIRVHGDYHLGQVLYTGNDFAIIDFEGEPARPLSERRLKRSALRDVAGMLRSFHYAPYAVVYGTAPGSYVRTEDRSRLETGARFWHQWVGAAFLRAYLAESANGKHLPTKPEAVDTLLNAFLIEKALYEIVYELNNRPDWVRIPVRGILDLVG